MKLSYLPLFKYGFKRSTMFYKIDAEVDPIDTNKFLVYLMKKMTFY